MATERILLTIPQETMKKVRRLVPKRKYSKLISEAVDCYLKEREKKQLREKLKEGYKIRAKSDLKLAEDFFLAEQEVWDKLEDKF